MIKRLWSVLLVLCLILPACAGAEPEAEPAKAAPGMWYEVFVYSYSDSDGNGHGDLNGLKGKLSYISDMGYTGLWLMPIMPSPSYHKYDVTNYKDVDPLYGTLDDMRLLVQECHELGLRLIIDLPVNHTSTRHDWFKLAANSLKFGNLGNKYISFYNFSQKRSGNMARLEDTSWYYEEQFSGGNMPDLNLTNPEVRRQLEKVIRFWLQDVDVDGFRLDAVTSFTDSLEGNIEVLRWINDTAKAVKPDCYIVGEAWTSLDQISRYYESGIDSFFLFPASQAEGYIVSALKAQKPADSYYKALAATESAIPDGIIAPFLCNHDTGRSVGLLQARSDPAKAKFGEGILNMFPGSVFTYYGEEIGMVGSGADPNKRIGMYWADGEITLPPPGATRTDYAYPGVYAQQADEASLLNYCKALNHLKAAYPVIMTGRSEALYVDGALLAMRRFDNDSECVIAINFDAESEGRIALPGSYALGGSLLTGSDPVALDAGESETNIDLPPYSIAILLNQD